MRVAFVQTYPIYHDLLSTEAWLARINRDRWMPGVLAQMGPEVELWGADHAASRHRSVIDGVGDYDVRLFASVQRSRHTKKHYSDDLVAYARRYDADVHVLKGVDGGVGERLIRKYLRPAGKPFVFVIGGKYYTRHVPQAALVMYETRAQREALRRPGWRLWRTPVPPERLVRLPKSIDTETFRPMPEVETRYDVVSVGRLIGRYKSYDALGALAEVCSVAVVGGGPAEADLRARYPKIHWLGQVPNREVPRYLNQGRLFMHAGLNDYYPRVLAEAMACGRPCLAFAEAIAPDVIPPGCGLRLDRDAFVAPVRALLDDPARCRAMSRQARVHAEAHLGLYSTRPALRVLLDRLGRPAVRD